MPESILYKRARQTALERQDLSCAYLAHHELESSFIMNIITIITIFFQKAPVGCALPPCHPAQLAAHLLHHLHPC